MCKKTADKIFHAWAPKIVWHFATLGSFLFWWDVWFKESFHNDPFWIMATLTLTLILVAIIKRTSLGGIKFISTSIFQEKGCMEWTHMFRFVFRKQYGLMFGPIYIKNKFMLWKCKHLYFKFQSPEFPLLAVTFQTQGLEVNINYMPPRIHTQNPKITINSDIFIKFFVWMIDFTQQFLVLEVIFETKSPGLVLNFR